ncbi:DivIVA domain-containing protein [Dactylosporangium sp. NPDC000244]|uniref:DivIVA domain-containing protein n=1 Tax=Dactylosporangium sp. NPDC000244 TaxID=3154365 RepID=UPI0033213E8F
MSQGQRFRRRAMRRGYKVDEVDSFLDRVEATLSGDSMGAPVSAQEVHDVVFRVRFGGYDEWQVDLHLDRVERQLAEHEERGSGGGGFGRALDSRSGELRMAPERMEPQRMPERMEPQRMPDRMEPQRMPDRVGMTPPPDRMGPPPGQDRMGPPGPDRMGPGPDRMGPPGPDRMGPPPGMDRMGPPMGGPMDRPADRTMGMDRPVDRTMGMDRPADRTMGMDRPVDRTMERPAPPPPGAPLPSRPTPPPPAGPPGGPGGPGGPGYGRYDEPTYGGAFDDDRGYDQGPRAPRADMTAEIRMERPEPPAYGGPGPDRDPYGAPPERDPYGGPQGGGDPYGGPPQHQSGEVARIDQLRRTFQLRRFGSGYDRAQVDRLFEGVMASLTGRGGPLTDGDLDPSHFNLVPGGYFEAEVDAALKEVRDIVTRRR